MQFAPVVLKDNADADHTFAPRDITAGVATFVESNGVPIADRRVTFAQTRVASSGRTKFSFKVVMPVVQDIVVNGISKPTVVRTAYADLTITSESTAGTVERADIRKHLISLLSSNFGTATIDALEVPY